MRISLSGGGFQEYAGQIGGFSHESEHDLAVMVSDFMENGSGGSLSWCSSDSDSVVPDLQHLAEKILVGILSTFVLNILFFRVIIPPPGSFTCFQIILTINRVHLQNS